MPWEKYQNTGGRRRSGNGTTKRFSTSCANSRAGIWRAWLAGGVAATVAAKGLTNG